ncbi:MAG: alanine--tRNA ligase [Alphaproteobacteria bacterium]
MKASDIRSTFLNYFEKNNHQIVDSSPLVPQNDPTLMFTNAGMVQFKNLFTGLETRDYKTATTSQKCVRAGGKHNDLENVGYTARHHTFFEMMGNFSFGDYFKENAIELAWNLLTKEYGLDKQKLLVTVYHDDNEAVEFWKKIAGLSDDKIIRIATDDNFWSMGDTGPCGPCTEIFYDHGEHIAGGPPGSPDEDGDRFIEIWNLVFMQFEQMEDGSRKDLPNPSIDTGMGLERLATILQGKHNNYDIDIIRNIIEHTASITGGNPDDASFKVIADHLRSSAFLLADGVMPSNEGRGYVLRRIMRRAMRHAHILGAKDPLMHQLVPSLVKEMGDHFTELKDAQSLITETLKLEETRFKETLDRGLKLLETETDKMGSGKVLDGKVAFTLYDTYGFPVDLTADILRGQDRSVDMAGFDSAMEEQKQKARAAWTGSGASKTDTVWFDVKDKVGATEFLGYENTKAEGVVSSIVVDSKETDKLSKGDEGVIITNQTPFYGESGGQVGDTGIIKNDNCELSVTDTQKALGDLFLHYVKVKSGEVKTNDAVELIVDTDRRQKIASNHSVTHLMHEALRDVLGDHIAQKGSLQNESLTRFDVSQPTAISDEDIIRVENIVNEQIRANTPITTVVTTPENGREMGAQALFGEKYGDEVRVVAMGTPEKGKTAYSIELCGGTHVKNTGEIGGFKIITETAVSAGVRRIEAITGTALNEYVRNLENVVAKLNDQLKSTTADLPNKVQSLQDANKKLDKELVDVRRKLASGGSTGEESVETVNGVNFIGRVVDLPAKELKGLADDLKSQTKGDTVIALISTDGGKVSIVVASSSQNHDAVALVKIGAEALGGKGGGGRADMAQAGGSNPNDADTAIANIKANL